jgi:acyl-CoA synthetase (AMP-forming)/AMP-acid ligase II
VSIEGADGGAAPELTLGEIHVAGPLVARGYLGEVSEGARFTSSALATGDAGFIHEGQLYVVGRMGDSVKIRGRHVYVEDVEAQLAALGALDRRSVVLPALDVGTEGLVLVVECVAGEWISAAVDIIRRATSDDARVRVVAVGKKGILRTSSGKPRRRVMWRRLLTGELQYRTLYDTEHAGPRRPA